jgi:hypothetical protein
MAVEIFHYDVIPQSSLPPAMTFLLTKWNTLSVMNKLALQAITESTSVNVVDNSAYMVPAGDDFFFTHMGKNVSAAIGQDHTGKLISTVGTTIGGDLLDAYRQVAAQEKPAFMRFTSSYAQNALVWERLVLPIPVRALGPILVCYSEVASHQQGVFEFLFNKARYPWVVTYPIFNAARELDDGWVLLMNDSARAAFSYHQPIGNLRLRELSLFQFGQLWTGLRECYAAAGPRLSVAFDQLEIEMVKVNNLLAYRLIAMSNASATVAPQRSVRSA